MRVSECTVERAQVLLCHAQLELQEEQRLQLELHILLDHLRLEDVDVLGGPDLLEQLQVDGLLCEAR